MAFRFFGGIPPEMMGGPRLPDPPTDEEVAEMYSRLEVPMNTPPDKLRRAYLKLARKKHPDRGGDPEEFRKIQEAYDILADDGKRTVFMRCGMEGVRAGLTQEDIDPRAARRAERARVPDLQVQLRCRLGDLMKPQVKTIEVPRVVMSNNERTQERVSVTVDIPAGAPDGLPIRLMEKGHVIDGSHGDLLVVLDVLEEGHYRRRGPDLIMQEEVTLREVLAGFTMRLPLLTGGRLTLGVPPGRGLGDPIVLRGYGLPCTPGGEEDHRGSIIVQLKVSVPRVEEGVRISEELATAAWEELPAEGSTHPRYNPSLFREDDDGTALAAYEGFDPEETRERNKMWARMCGQEQMEDEARRAGAGGMGGMGGMGGGHVVQCGQQ